MPAWVRPAMQALFAIDAAMADLVAKATDPNLARIKLAWWREQLEALDENPPPAEPRLQAIAQRVLSRAVSGAEIAKLEGGWAALLDGEIDTDLVASRGEGLFQIGGKLLGSNDWRLADAGALYALETIGNESVSIYRQRLRGHRFPAELRPLTMLARAARHQPGSRAAALAMLAHRWSGRIG